MDDEYGHRKGGGVFSPSTITILTISNAPAQDLIPHPIYQKRRPSISKKPQKKLKKNQSLIFKKEKIIHCPKPTTVY
jgi:hypothetical protein